MIDDKIIERTAKTLNTDVDTLRAKADDVYASQGATWVATGKSEADAYALSIKVAGTQIRNENAALLRSGATMIHGMFVSVPRTNDWGTKTYNKNKTELLNADEGARMAKVDAGAVVIFTDNHDGTYTRYAKEEFFGAEETTVTELPRHTMRLDADTHFYCVWDNTNKTFPNGNANFKYGNPRPQDDRERVSLFVGSESKDGTWRVISVRGSGKSADVQWPTFTPGSLAVGMGQNKNVGYLKANLLDFTADHSVADMFPEGPDGVLADARLTEQEIAPLTLLPNLMALGDWGDSLVEKTGSARWNAIAAIQAEIIHIDPRNNGASTLVCADLDVSSTAPVVEVYCPADRAVDFGVGTKIILLGSTWKDRNTNEQRMGVTGWWPFDPVASVMLEEEDSGDILTDGEW